VTGAQDNGSQLHNSTQWQTVGGADGGECIIDYTDTNIYYYTYQYGTLNRRGQGIGNITQPPNAGTSNNAWITPYLIHPKDPKILFYGGKDIYKTMNRGNIWSSISNKLTAADGVGGGMIRSMAISESNPDSVLYAASYVVVYRTTDAGQTWQNITSNLPTSAGCFDCSAISGIAVHPDNPDIAWVTMSGYSDKNKIFKTVDGGKTWQNISSNLPYVPVNCIVYQKGSKDAIYIGTDIGVFFKDSTMNSWLPFMTGLPNVPVSELEIHYGSQTIRAATFGRGLWESNLYGALNSINTQSEEVKPDLIVPNPASEYIELPEGMSGDKELAIYNALGSLILRMKPEGSRMNINFLPQGIYFLKIDGKVSKFVKQ